MQLLNITPGQSITNLPVEFNQFEQQTQTYEDSKFTLSRFEMWDTL